MSVASPFRFVANHFNVVPIYSGQGWLLWIAVRAEALC